VEAKNSRWTAWSSSGYILVVGVLVAAYIAYLIVAIYRSEIDVRRYFLDEVKLEADHHVMALGYFFDERRDDMATLATSREVDVYFENRALGMSKAYGLDLSLDPIREKFTATIDRKKISNRPIYSRIVLIDADGALLVDVTSGSRGRRFEWKKLLEARYKGGIILASPDGEEIMASMPYFFRGRYSGQVVAWINGQNMSSLLDKRGRTQWYLLIDIEGGYVPAPFLPPPPGIRLPETGHIMDGVPKEFSVAKEQGEQIRVIGVCLPVPGTPFFVASLAVVDQFSGYRNPKNMLAEVVGLAILLLGGVVLILRINGKALVLQTRLRESAAREREITEKNKQLEVEIQERVRAESQLRESEERNRTVIENSSDGIAVVKEGSLFFANSKYLEMFGFQEPGEVVGKPIISVVDTPDQAAVAEFAEKRQAGEPAPARYEFSGRRRDGALISVEVSAVRTVLGGEPVLLAFLSDITERKERERELRYAKEQAELLYRLVPSAIFTVDRARRITSWNNKAQEITGYSYKEALGRECFLFAKSPCTDRCGLYSADVEKPVIGRICTIATKSGQERIISKNVDLLKDVSGEVIGGIESFEDITERRRAEEQQQEQLHFLQTLIDTIPNPIFYKDAEGRYLGCNKAFEEYYGVRREEIIGRTVVELRPYDEAVKHREADVDVMSKAGHMVYEMSVALPKGGCRTVVNEKAAFTKPDGTVAGLVGSVIDITERKRAEESFREAKEAAEAANRAKSEFLASMSHEIRTPMNAIIGMADLLAETPLTPEQQNYVLIFKSAGENLLGIINDILDLSKVEAGHLELEAVSFDLVDLAERTCEIMAMRAHKKGIELMCHVRSGVPTHVIGDPSRLRQILTNIVGNAIKFTEKGEVTVTVQSEPLLQEGEGGVQPAGPADVALPGALIHILVRDTGIGIPAEKQETIFESFTQADSSTARKYGGTGLGLSIARRLVAIMHGTIGVESEPGKGSTFRISFPCRLGKVQEDATGPVRDIGGLRTLVVDDNETNRLILREMLVRWGARVSEAEDGPEALAELVKGSVSGDPYGLVVLDKHMPGMDGFEVAAQIRDNPRIGRTTVMMLVSLDKDGDIARASELGVSRYLVKPVKRSDLKDAIVSALRNGEAPETLVVQQPAPPVSSDHPFRILLVDDSADNRFLIQAYLKHHPFAIDTAENGQEAVDKYINGTFDLVLMDIQMPVMDGYTATREIIAWEKAHNQRHVPIVALTAFALKEDVEKILAAGCDTHVAKPVKKATLLRAIEEYGRAGEVVG
jgi:PAS domain S-box-containing protein